MATDTSVRGKTVASGAGLPVWWMGIFEKALSGYSTSIAAEQSATGTHHVLLVEPRPRLSWFPAVMENLDRLPWGPGTWSSEGARPLDDKVVLMLLLLLHDFLPPDGPPPVISPTWDGGVQADWELGDLYLEIEITPDGATRCCFVDERGEDAIEEEFQIDGHEDTLRARMVIIVAAASIDP